jgi:hypothetical protein
MRGSSPARAGSAATGLRPARGDPAAGPRRTGRLALIALVASVAALAAAGAAISVGLIERGASEPALPELPGPFGVRQDIPTSFGAVAVDGVEKINGLTARKLAGVTHGIANLVPPNKTQVEASVTLTNLLDRPVEYSPTQFRLLVGRRRTPVGEVRAGFLAGTLQPSASVSGRLAFVAPRTGSRLWIEFTDPRRGKPILVDLGKTGRTPAGAFDGFHRQH